MFSISEFHVCVIAWDSIKFISYVTRRGPDNQVDVPSASEVQVQDGSRQSVIASTIQNESSQTRVRIVTVSSEAMSLSNPASSEMKVYENAAPKIALEKDGPKKVVNNDECRKAVKVETMHISCKSDTYEDGQEYAGVIIYQYYGKSEWRTANGTHCKSGYIVIQNTNSKAVKQWRGKEPGAVHGAVYRNAFGESVNTENVVGEGFSLRKEKSQIKFKNRSSVFNNPKDSEYHDKSKTMHEISELCVHKIVEHWKTAGSSWVDKKRTFDVKDLLSDSELESLDSDTKARAQKNSDGWQYTCLIV